jgi:serine/threonine-protein kinase
MLVAGLCASLMEAVGMWAAQLAGGHPIAHPIAAITMHLGTYFMAATAVIISHVVTRMGREIGRARELGSYLLGELLGEGGMGQVYRATHRLLARPAAIKLIRPEAMSAEAGESVPTATRRFRREAQVAASLRSPHTVELYDFGITEDRTYYFVMELLDGMDLEHLVREFGPLPADRVLHILFQVCASLSEAHSRGLVHRDIKPANIHLGRLGLEHDFVKVLDFGLVKSASATTGEHSLTGVGLTPGTPAYMAPEAALGEDVDGRADLYSLGCVAYYLLTGKVVFEGMSPMQVISRHLQEQPIPPSQRTEMQIPAALEQLVLACLGKKPEDRPQHAAALVRGLSQVPVNQKWTEERAAHWWSINRPYEQTA